MNYSEIESKVREATNDDPWGPSGQLMGEIAKYVDVTHIHMIMADRLYSVSLHTIRNEKK